MTIDTLSEVFMGFPMHDGRRKMFRIWLCLAVFVAVGVVKVAAQSADPSSQTVLTAGNNTNMETTDDWNRRLQQLVHSAITDANNRPSPADYRIGPNDMLKVTVFDAPDLSQEVRVSGDGNISLPLLGTIKAAGLTPRELQLVLQALLRRTYMKDPQVTVTVTEMQSHSVSVLGAVKTPGVFQIRGTKTLLEMLSMAQGLAPDAGNAVMVMRGAGNDFGSNQPPTVGTKGVAAADAQGGASASLPSASSANTGDGKAIEISLKRLLDSGDPRYNIAIYPGDIIKVKAAGIVYVVGDVNRPGGFPIQDNEHMTVLQAIALGQGIGTDAQKNKAKIIRLAENGQQIELPIRLNDILAGKAPDPVLQPKDVLFIPKNGAASAGKAALRTFSQWIVWRAVP